MPLEANEFSDLFQKGQDPGHSVCFPGWGTPTINLDFSSPFSLISLCRSGRTHTTTKSVSSSCACLWIPCSLAPQCSCHLAKKVTTSRWALSLTLYFLWSSLSCSIISLHIKSLWYALTSGKYSQSGGTDFTLFSPLPLKWVRLLVQVMIWILICRSQTETGNLVHMGCQSARIG